MIARCTALMLGVALIFGLAGDLVQPASTQVTARLYQAAVEGYRAYVHPITGQFIRCRYQPTCSYYSSEAVKRFGIVRGLKLTFARLLSCRPSVPPGTLDPVPAS
jgi:putative membrane protein insertion efficiency factor